MSTQVIIPDSPRVPVLPEDSASPPKEAEKQRMERRKAFGPLLDFLKNTCRKVEDEDKDYRLKVLQQMNLCRAYYDNRVYGMLNDKGEWEDYADDNAEFRPKDNKYKEQVDKLEMEMSRSWVDLAVEPADENDSALKEAAEFVLGRIEANRKRLFTQRPEFVIAENKSLLLNTITYRYTYFDARAKDGPKEKRPKFGKETFGEEKALTICALCGMKREGGYDDSMEAASPCPQCGAQTTRQLQSEAIELSLPSGYEEVPCGLVRCVHADPSMVEVSSNARLMSIASSPYLIWTQMVERGKLEKMFPDKVIPSGSDLDRKAEYRSENEGVSNSPFDAVAGDVKKGGEQFERLKFKLIWLDPWVYGDYVSQKPEKLPDGKELQAGTPLIDLFPKGLCIAKVGDMPLALYSEDKNKKWSVCVYGLREHAFHGSGTNALIPIQKTILDLLGYRVGNVYYNTNRREFVRKGAFDGDALPRYDEVCIVNYLDENRNIIGNAYEQAPGIPLPPEVIQLAQEQSGSLQEQAGTSSLSLAGTSAESQALGTATGIAAMRDMAVGRMGPNLQLKAAMEVETMFQILEAEQANYSKQHLLRLAGLSPDKPSGNLGYTLRGVEAFINSDIRADFLITPIPGSWMPATEPEKKADAIAMAEYASKVENPEIVANLAKALKQPMSIGGWNATQREAARRVEEFASVVKLMEAQGAQDSDEAAAMVLLNAVNARLDSEMDDHKAFMDFYKDWWVSDESRTARPLLKRVVKLRTIEHKDAMTGQVTDANERVIQTQVPQQTAQMAVAEAQSQQQLGMQQAQAEQQLAQQQQALALEGEKANQELESEAARLAIEKEREGVRVESEGARAAIKANDREHQLAVREAMQTA